MSAATQDRERLDALEALDIINAPKIRGLDELCEIAAVTFSVPSVFVSLIDDLNQIIKAAHNMDVPTIPRTLSVCQHTIAQTDTLVVSDLLEDPRFRDNPLIQQSQVRFYAGAPLRYEDEINIGSFCIIDRRPRDFGAHEEALLRQFAGIAMGLMRESALIRESESQREQLDEADRALQRQHRIMAQTERLSHIGGWEMPIEGESAIWSDEVYRIADLPIGSRITLDDVLAFFGPSDSEILVSHLRTLARTGLPFDIELEGRTHSGIARWVRITGEREMLDERPNKLIGVVQDVSSRHAEQRRLWHMANHDALTGLPNRAYFNERFQTALGQVRRSKAQLALLLLDLDHFKDINDTLGHSAGDAFLRAVAQNLRLGVRQSDFVARLGGDEFAVILMPAEDLEDARSLGARLLTEVEKPFEGLGNKILPSGSIGIALYPDHGTTTLELMQNADIALYAAKAAGRANAQVFAAEDRVALERRLDDVAAFREALKNGDIEMHYQPQIRIDDGRLHGFEALTRWRLADGTYRTAGDFAAVFEDPESASALGEFALATVTEDLANWRRHGVDPCKVSINASAIELRKPNYVNAALEALKSHGLRTHLLEIEITESVFFGHQGWDAGAVIDALHRNGIRIALDDFGTGFASLVHLKRYPVDQIKIDRAFVTDLGHNGEDLAIVRAMVTLADSLGIATVAEGVETQDQLACLRALGCDYAQGFWFSPAVPAGDALSLMKSIQT